MTALQFAYEFKGDDGSHFAYDVKIDDKTLLSQTSEESLPFWTELCYKKCEHCPLDEREVSHCPLAANIHRLIENFQSASSYGDTLVSCVAPDRTYSKNTDMQTGLGSLFGLVMATSACPSMAFLRPMARFHLPFSTLEETVFRALGAFLVRRFLQDELDKEGITRDLSALYAEVNKVNAAMVQRMEHLLAERKGDADQNAIVILDTLATILTMELESNISSISSLFS